MDWLGLPGPRCPVTGCSQLSVISAAVPNPVGMSFPAFSSVSLGWAPGGGVRLEKRFMCSFSDVASSLRRSCAGLCEH